MSFDPDAKFERALLESARGDAGPRDISDAWARFAGALAAAPAAAGGGVATGDALSRVAPAAARGARVGAIKWLLLGALGGAAPMAAFVLWHRPAVTVATAGDGALSTGARTAPGPAAPPTSWPGTRPEAPHETTGAPTPARRRATLATAEVPLCRASAAPAATTDGMPSTLSAEVSRIDTARTASAHGDYDEAMRLVDHYHRDFPRGALGPDADVVALDAAAAESDQPEVARRGALFLARYPNDPHAARVRALVARARAR